MREKFRDFITDYYKVGMTILDLLLLASMPFKPDFTWDHFTYFSLISRILFPLVVLIFGNKGVWVFYYFTAIVKTLDITFNDFTAISAICILTLFVDKKHEWLKWTTIVTYIISIFLVATLHQKEPYHLYAHFTGCCMLYLTVYKLRHRDKKVLLINSSLELTNDEIIIIEELLKGKVQKEIEQFSPNTVSNKLKNARERNGIEDTDKLLTAYREQKL